MKKLFSALLIPLALSISFTAFAQPGANDPAFNVTDKGFGYGDAANGIVNAVAVQEDGKIIIGGGFTAYNGVAMNYIARLNADGSLDATFNIGAGANNNINDIVLQGDGKILISGFFSTYNGTARNRIARLNADGTLDGTFTIGTGPNGIINTIVLQSDGKVLVGGDFTAYNGGACNRIARLNADGNLDGTFTIGTGANGSINAIALQSDGKILIGGDFTTYNGVARNQIARLTTGGSLDGTFSVGAGSNGGINVIAVQTGGKILVGGYFTTFSGAFRKGMVRLGSDGTLDGFFVVQGINGGINAIAFQSDGKVVVGGGFSIYNAGVYRNQNNVARLNSDGILDVSFIIEAGLNFYSSAIALQRDGKAIVCGESHNGAGRHLTRLDTDGSLDVLFNAGTGANGIIRAIVLQSDGKIIIGGDFTTYNGVVRNHIARLHADGSLDTSFAGVGTDSAVHAMAVQKDGKIVIGGRFQYCNDKYYYRIARLNPDGSLDATFNLSSASGAMDMQVYSIAIQEDGKIIMGGNISRSTSTGYKYAVIRLNQNGSIDTSFGADTEMFLSVYSITLQKDGKIIIGGDFSAWNSSVERRSIARLNADGNLDDSFNAGNKFSGDIRSIATQNDGKIIIGGAFSIDNNVSTHWNAARLNTNGSIDYTFSGQATTYDRVFATVIQNDGKVIVGGEFKTYNGIAVRGIARLDVHGNLDAGFAVREGANDIIRTVALQSDGKVIAGGDFTAYRGTGRNRIARIMTLPCTNPAVPTLGASALVNCGTESTTLNITDGNLNSATEWKWYAGSCGGTPAGSGTSLTVSPAVTTTYYARGEGGCVAPGVCASITIAVNALPDTVTSLHEATITVSQSGGGYQWLDCSRNSQPIAGATGQSYAPVESGEYAVAVTSNGCSATSSCVSVTIATPEEEPITATEETVVSPGRLTVFPNPSNGMFTVQSSGKGVYSVKNDLGQTVQWLTLHDANSYTANITDLKPGVYFIVGFNRNESTTKKIVVTE